MHSQYTLFTGDTPHIYVDLPESSYTTFHPAGVPHRIPCHSRIISSRSIASSSFPTSSLTHANADWACGCCGVGPSWRGEHRGKSTATILHQNVDNYPKNLLSTYDSSKNWRGTDCNRRTAGARTRCAWMPHSPSQLEINIRVLSRVSVEPDTTSVASSVLQLRASRSEGTKHEST